MLVGTGPLNGKCKKEKIKHDNKIKKKKKKKKNIYIYISQIGVFN